MKKSLKNKALSVLIAAVMTAVMIPFGALTAHAEGAVINVTSAAELKEALNRKTVVDAINITADFTVNEDCMIRYDPEHLQYYSKTVITVNEGVTLTVGEGGEIGSLWPSFEGDWESELLPAGKIINNGTVIIENGGATEADFDTNNGDILVCDGGYAVVCNVNNGTVTVEDGGEYTTSQGGEPVNNGLVKIHEGGQMTSRFGSTIVNGENGTIRLDGVFNCACFGFGEGMMLFDNKGTVTGSGSVILYEGAHDEAPVEDMDKMIERMMEQLGQETRFENWDDISIYKIIEASSFEDVAAATTGERTVAGERVEGDMDTVIAVYTDIVVPEGGSVRTMAAMVILPDCKVTVKGGGVLECALYNSGTVEVKSGGGLYTTMGGDITNENVIVIEKGASLTSQMGGSVLNLNGASLTLDGTFYCGCIGDGTNDGCWFDNIGGVVNGSGRIVLYEAAPDFMPVSDMSSLYGYVEERIGKEGESGPGIKPVTGDIFDWEPGDINGDKAVDNKDIVALFRYVSGGGGSVNEYALDTNGDSEVDNKDIVNLFRYVSGGKVTLSDRPYIR